MNASLSIDDLYKASGLTIDEIVRVAPDPAATDRFLGKGAEYAPLLIYGGHLLGQGLHAGLQTVDPAMSASSLHANFVSAGKPKAPVVYTVERLRDGRRYATRSIRAMQGERLLLIMTASFKTPEDGDCHQAAMPEVESAEALKQARTAAGRRPLALPITRHGVEFEGVEDWHPMSKARGRPAIAHWMRTRLAGPVDAHLRQALLAFLSDGTMMFSAIRPHGDFMRTHRATSLDHSVWFYGDADLSEWMLFDQQSPVAADGRGLNHGAIFTQDGRLIAGVAQECMMTRVKPGG